MFVRCLLVCFLFVGGLVDGEVWAESPSSKPANSPASLVVFHAKRAERFVKLSLHCTVREFPYKLGQVLGGERDLLSPRTLHPAFYGCFDWHSAVHGHWSMVRLLKLFPKIPSAKAIRNRLHEHLTYENIRQEAAFFQSKFHHTFERPYGWGWFLRLVGEVHTWKHPEARKWRANLRPLETLLVKRTFQYLTRLSVPVRAGTHASTAYALVHIYDYAKATNHRPLMGAIVKASLRFYGKDRSCPTAYEPSGEDFISPCLVEADLMRRILSQKRYTRWLSKFLPKLDSSAFASVRNPPEIRDKKDYKIGHLIGLSLQRAGAMQGIAWSLSSKDPRRKPLLSFAQRHLRSALGQMFASGYGGSHWLASFAIYTLTRVGVQHDS